MRLARLGIRSSGPLYLLTVRDQVDYEGFRAPHALEAAGRGAGIASSPGLARETLRDAAMEHFITCVPFTQAGSNVRPPDELEATYARLTLAPGAVSFDELRQTSGRMQQSGSRFMLELSFPADQVIATMRDLQAAGTQPDVWLVPPLASADAYAEVVATAKRDGRIYAGSLVHDREQNDHDGERCLQMAAAAGFTGFVTTVADSARTPASVASSYAKRARTFSSARRAG